MIEKYFILLAVFKVVLAVHESMSSLELKHFFGTDDKHRVPQYYLDKPKMSIRNGGAFEMELLVDGTRKTFVMRNKPHLFSEGFHAVSDNSETLVSPLHYCVFEGTSKSQNDTHISLVGCGNNYHGMIITGNGEYHLIQPHTQSGNHIIHKRSIDSIEHECQFDENQDPYPEDRQESVMRSALMRLVKDIRRSEHKKDILTVELAVFADDAMWEHFRKMYGVAAEENMHTFIMAVVNNIDVLYTQRLIQPRINIKIVRYEILKNIPQTMNVRQHASGDVDKLLDAFCQYQNELNPKSDSDPRHWDHALLFSGYDLHRNGVKTVAGYAPVKGMCSGVRSCTINEGLDFGSVFVVTHEMGHSLGMYHDGDNDCDLRCCIMSPSVGSGKTHWSRCSVNEMQTFVGHLGEDFRPPNCLQDTPNSENKALPFKASEAPGQLFTLDEQCEIFHGECWKHELKDTQVLQDVCSMVWCGNGEGIIRTAHPALEGTYCGFGKICHQGRCISTNRLMRVIPGGWSDWNDRPEPACGGRCSPCEIRGQIRISRSIRQCNNPSPNNGGAVCNGDEARGIVCHKDICMGESIENYATRVCTKLRNENAIPNTMLSGEGMQFEQAMCKIWCLISGSTNIRTVSNFPDGTPCGYNQYCIKGECRMLRCGGAALAYSEADCPIFAPKPTNNNNNINKNKINNNNNGASSNNNNVHSVDRTTKTNPYKDHKKIPFLNEWSGWSDWSECVTYDCRTPGVKVRVRRCLAGVCVGQLRERISCSQPCTGSESPTTTAAPPQQTFRNKFVAPLPTRSRSVQTTTRKLETPIWGVWSDCSVTCGNGQRIRRRMNCIGSDCSETGSCTMLACSQNTWTEWSNWSQCSLSCGSGLQFRKRACFASFCKGRDSDARKCNEQRCAGSENPNAPGKWTEWSAWSSCSTKCGTGHRSRRRRCYQGICTETKISGMVVSTFSRDVESVAFAVLAFLLGGVILFISCFFVTKCLQCYKARQRRLRRKALGDDDDDEDGGNDDEDDVISEIEFEDEQTCQNPNTALVKV
ncbi:unnamed protein product [Caenorhabditis bovis]|uniref:Peptidase M12B domain-containing protein n=1 Tax=Caenorhabditis bovis TaxID=2654633 RepID=A0A8S1E613_9PELO|nr:unnamed protein product [Caenorhabditis bovis]